MLTLNWEIIWDIVNILVLYLLLKLFLFKPVTKMLDSRKKIIEGRFAEADKRKKDADDEKQKYDKMIASANDEAERILKEAREKAAGAYRRTVEQAEQDAKLRIEQAERQIEQERRQMLQSTKDELASVALLAADRLVKECADKNNPSFLDEFITEAGAFK